LCHNRDRDTKGPARLSVAAEVSQAPKSNRALVHTSASINPVVRYGEYQGIECGVRQDGQTFMTLRGAARVCGVEASSVHKLLSTEASADTTQGGVSQSPGLNNTPFGLALAQYGHVGALFEPLQVGDQVTHALPETVYSALIMYYAVLGRHKTEEAQQAQRTLLRAGGRALVYELTGYQAPSSAASKHQPTLDVYYERREASTLPPLGYFNVFGQLTDVLIRLLDKGALPFNDKCILDISAGKYWADVWRAQNLEARFGRSIKARFRYPASFRQARARNLTVTAYPMPALGDFHHTLQRYMSEQFPRYIIRKVDDGSITAAELPRLLDAATAAYPLRLVTGS
jgi:hypothetical protein